MKILIKNGKVINPATKLSDIKDILVDETKVVKIDTNINEDADEIIDANGCLVVPGLIDVHVHLREPGYEYKETIETGTKSAAKGGFTSVCPMPNTNPVTDSIEIVDYIKTKAKNEGIVNVLPVGAITIGQKGEALVDIKALKDAGICAISEDGRSVLNSLILKEAMEVAKQLDIPVLSHCEDDDLAKGGCMNEGEVSKRLGLKGIPNLAEDVITARDILISEAVDSKLHLCHVSTKESIQLIREAKNRKAKVTCEVCPHHFSLTDETITGHNPEAKMNPPLRTQADVDAILDAFKDNIIDIIATDHAPHSAEEKSRDFDKAPNGIVGFETAVPLTITNLLEKGYISEERFVELLSYNPAKMLGIDRGNIDVGCIADITIINPKEEYVIDKNDFHSKSNNTPFDQMTVRGRVKYTIVDGKVAYRDLKINHKERK